MRTIGPISFGLEAGEVRVLLADEERTDFISAALLSADEVNLVIAALVRTKHEAEQQRQDQARDPGPIATGAELR